MADIPMPNSILPLRRAYEDAARRRDAMDMAKARLRRLSPSCPSRPAAIGGTFFDSVDRYIIEHMMHK